ncbi:hypothetical protein HYPSUDRAFT_206111 [Hypholoma sublateritium FD-334 SS-4]|uniref:Uncharacterized protein n=1 Tax=Hypholoma sublateritium (strain FD-334 SS-4) TaxID=945553 RepID=A0A0D2NEN0_HYPSF|nr:hypothetical protein HYPSUDRAFT_206111 [Hypholoma sublateritium FD-334 SS-4]
MQPGATRQGDVLADPTHAAHVVSPLALDAVPAPRELRSCVAWLSASPVNATYIALGAPAGCYCPSLPLLTTAASHAALDPLPSPRLACRACYYGPQLRATVSVVYTPP